MASLAEGFSLAEKAGLDQYMVLEVLNLSDISCPMVDTKGTAILEVSYNICRVVFNLHVLQQRSQDVTYKFSVALIAQ